MIGLRAMVVGTLSFPRPEAKAVNHDDHGLALLAPSEMSLADQLTIAAGTPGAALMENAGYAVADDIAARYPQGTRAAVVCGPGNNGGDGFVVARVLAERGFVVRLGLAGERGKLTGDAARAAARWTGAVEDAAPDLLRNAVVIVDALFGAGLARPIEGVTADLVAAINEAGRRGAVIVAVDLPSGIDGRTGAVLGVAVEATRSVTFFRPKPGHVLTPGRRHTGRLIVADIGIKPAVLGTIGVKTFLNLPGLWRGFWPTSDPNSYKYSRGAVLVASGPVHASGAARLAAAAALRSGAGIVTVAAPPDAVAVVAAYKAAFVVKPVERAQDIENLAADPRLRAAVIGPGFGVGAPTLAAILAILSGPAVAVLDADAITAAAANPAEVFKAIGTRAAPVVMTPHEGEFQRLFGDIAGSKLDRARAASVRSGAIMIIKGPDTVIAAPDGRAAINVNAPPTLATAGSGDVLAGIIAGLAAQGVPAFEAAAMATWIHGSSGEIAGVGLIADDLVEAIRDVMRQGCPADD
jgi:hydroxyethylthiazole kinase-like uncharacterized protein yjeF